MPPWVIAQMGAREHYAVPRALLAHGALAHFYTDYWCRRGKRVLRHGPRLARALSGRYHGELSDAPVTAFNGWALREALHARLRRTDNPYLTHVRQGAAFARRVRAQLETHGATSYRFLGFSTQCLEVLAYLRERGVRTVVDQIAPGPAERRIIEAEVERWPGWSLTPLPDDSDHEARCRQEWALADTVLVNSEWSRDALVGEGLPSEKIVVVPLAYEAPAPPPQHHQRTRRSGPLRALWLGTVTLRKGIQYLIEAANQLDPAVIQMDVVGPLQISPKAMAAAPRSLRFHGPVTRDEAAAHYVNADIFVFPTLSDGFGITQIEAMAHGLPVIATPHCGSVVEPEVDGLVIPARDSAALAHAILRLAKDRALVEAMSERARRKASSFTLTRYAETLERALGAAPEEDSASA